MKIGVVTFPGSLDDRDAARAVRAVGAEPVSLWHGDADLRGVDAVILPGGFSYGDYLRCGAIARFAPVMERDHRPGEGRPAGPGHLQRLPDPHRVAPAARRADPQRPPQVQLHRHPAAGRERADGLDLGLRDGPGDHHRPQERRGRVRRRPAHPRRARGGGPRGVPLRRPEGGRNPNGSYRDIAGIANERGNVVGLMPHPEHCVEEGYGPSTDGLGFFTSVLKQVVSA